MYSVCDCAPTRCGLRAPPRLHPPKTKRASTRSQTPPGLAVGHHLRKSASLGHGAPFTVFHCVLTHEPAHLLTSIPGHICNPISSSALYREPAFSFALCCCPPHHASIVHRPSAVSCQVQSASCQSPSVSASPSNDTVVRPLQQHPAATPASGRPIINPLSHMAQESDQLAWTCGHASPWPLLGLSRARTMHLAHDYGLTRHREPRRSRRQWAEAPQRFRSR